MTLPRNTLVQPNAASSSVSLTLRVPQDSYKSFLAAAAQSRRVAYQNQQAGGITTPYMGTEGPPATPERAPTAVARSTRHALDIVAALSGLGVATGLDYRPAAWLAARETRQ